MGRDLLKRQYKLDILFDSLAAPILASGKLEPLRQYIQHGTCTCYDHVMAVAKTALSMAMHLPFRFKKDQLVRGALLHDYFLYDWHTVKLDKLHGFAHPKIALENARREFDLTPIEENIIVRHMFPLTPVPPRYRESILVMLADKHCANKEFFSELGRKLSKKKFFAPLAHAFSLLIALLPWT